MAGRSFFSLGGCLRPLWHKMTAITTPKLKQELVPLLIHTPLFHLTETQFKHRYRLSKKVFKFLWRELRRLTNLRSSQSVSLEHKVCKYPNVFLALIKVHGISFFLSYLQVLTALFFFATGSYQKPVRVAKHLSQKMCSVYIEQVIQTLTHRNIINKYIRFPDTTAARQAVSQR